MPIKVTIEGQTAAEVKALVFDLASTIGGIPAEDIPADTTVSTLQDPAPVAAAAEEKPAPKKDKPTEAPAAKTYTVEELRAKATALSQAGKRQHVKDLLAEFGVSAVSAIKPEQSASFMERLEALND